MVTLTLGKKWQAQVEEIANLKAEKAELQESLCDLQSQLATLQRGLARCQHEKAETLAEATDLKEKLNSYCEREGQRDRDMDKLRGNECEAGNALNELRNTVASLQNSLDISNSQVAIQSSLIEKLKEEVSSGESLRDNVEKIREQCLEEYNRKQKELDLAQRANEHSRKHINILVKEKDRLLSKGELSHSGKPETQILLSPVTSSNSWNQVEVLRLKNIVQQLQQHSNDQQKDVEKLKKENWNLLNRLRNQVRQ